MKQHAQAKIVQTTEIGRSEASKDVSKLAKIAGAQNTQQDANQRSAKIVGAKTTLSTC